MKYVYVLRGADNQYKVGIATDVRSRLASIQTSYPHRLTVLTCKLVADAPAVEAALHAQLAEHRLAGEWFKLTDSQALELCVALHRTPTPKIADRIKVSDALERSAERYRALVARIDQLAKVIDGIAHAVEKPVEDGQAPATVSKPKVSRSRPEAFYIERAMEVFSKEGKASTSMLQRHLQIGYQRAARIVETLELNGFISEADPLHPSRTRKVLGVRNPS